MRRRGGRRRGRRCRCPCRRRRRRRHRRGGGARRGEGARGVPRRQGSPDAQEHRQERLGRKRGRRGRSARLLPPRRRRRRRRGPERRPRRLGLARREQRLPSHAPELRRRRRGRGPAGEGGGEPRGVVREREGEGPRGGCRGGGEGLRMFFFWSMRERHVRKRGRSIGFAFFLQSFFLLSISTSSTPALTSSDPSSDAIKRHRAASSSCDRGT